MLPSNPPPGYLAAISGSGFHPQHYCDHNEYILQDVSLEDDAYKGIKLAKLTKL